MSMQEPEHDKSKASKHFVLTISNRSVLSSIQEGCFTSPTCSATRVGQVRIICLHYSSVFRRWNLQYSWPFNWIRHSTQRHLVRIGVLEATSFHTGWAPWLWHTLASALKVWALENLVDHKLEDEKQKADDDGETYETSIGSAIPFLHRTPPPKKKPHTTNIYQFSLDITKQVLNIFILIQCILQVYKLCTRSSKPTIVCEILLG